MDCRGSTLSPPYLFILGSGDRFPYTRSPRPLRSVAYTLNSTPLFATFRVFSGLNPKLFS